MFPRSVSNRTSKSHHRLFSQITKIKRQEEQKMINTKDTQHNKQDQACSQNLDLIKLKLSISKQLESLKFKTAEQIAQISVSGGGLEIPNVMKRLKPKFEKQLLDLIFGTLNQNLQLDKHLQSVQKRKNVPKQLGSTIEHTQFTPRSIQTPGFDFDSQGTNKINEFTVKSNQFTLNPKSNEDKKQQNNDMQSRTRTVSQFSIGQRNPTSKRIKDKIMNSKKY